MAAEELVVTVTVEEGNRTGEPIATYCPSRKERHLVFMPSQAPVGKKVRVKLVDTGKTDKRLQTLYRGVPAKIEYTERWKDKGNGTIALVTIATNWLLEESEAGERDVRQPVMREGMASTRKDKKVIWGTNLVTTKVEVVETRVIPIETETVQGGKLVWSKTSEREEPGQPVQYDATKLEMANCTWQSNRYAATYEAGWSVELYVYYHETSSESWHKVSATWATMPSWWQKEQEALFPVCSCNRKRRDAQTPDGYAKCEQCRQEENCQECRKQAKIVVHNGKMLCDKCLGVAKQVALVEQALPVKMRSELATLAKTLLTGSAVPQEGGEVIMRSTLDHIDDDRTRKDIGDHQAGYPWYYFTDQGVFGTKFAAAALQILQYLNVAGGNQLVELVAWLSERHKAQECESDGDYYFRTQVQGSSTMSLPTLTEERIQKAVLAVKLRGSEAERQEAMSGYAIVVQKLGAESPQAKSVGELLQGYEQDYGAAAAKIRELKVLIDQEDRGEIRVNFTHYKRRMGMSRNTDCWVVRPDGTLREADQFDRRKSYPEGTYHWNLIHPDELVLGWMEVVKLPVNGLTAAQCATVRDIELNDIYCVEGKFGLNKSLNEERQQFADVVMTAIGHQCPACHDKLELTFENYDALTGDGVCLCGSENDILQWLRRNREYVNQEQMHEWPERCASRNAKIVFSKSSPVGTIEVLVYHKWGNWNLHLRVRTAGSTTQNNPQPDIFTAETHRGPVIAKTSSNNSEGFWQPHPGGKQHWFVCPHDHSERIKNAQSGQRYECSICEPKRSYLMK